MIIISAVKNVRAKKQYSASSCSASQVVPIAIILSGLFCYNYIYIRSDISNDLLKIFFIYYAILLPLPTLYIYC